MVCASWRWDLYRGQEIKDSGDANQRWQKWPIRLSKMCRALEIFMENREDVKNLFKNAIAYAIILLNYYKKFTYGGKDLTPYFI